MRNVKLLMRTSKNRKNGNQQKNLSLQNYLKVKLAEGKADLKRRLDENTEKMVAIKKMKKNIAKINKVLK